MARLDLGTTYDIYKDLTLGIHGYNLIGMFDEKFNKQYFAYNYDQYQVLAPSLLASIDYKF